MASHDVRILAPIPGRSAIGVEVPEQDAPDRDARRHPREPRGEEGEAPARGRPGPRHRGPRGASRTSRRSRTCSSPGQTGAGKSSCINSIVTSILMRTTPDQVRLILVDPKRVELGQYNDVPHLLTEVVTNPKKAANALDWAVREMEMRYDLLAEVGVRDITGYNAMFDRGELPTARRPRSRHRQGATSGCRSSSSSSTSSTTS